MTPGPATQTCCGAVSGAVSIDDVRAVTVAGLGVNCGRSSGSRSAARNNLISQPRDVAVENQFAVHGLPDSAVGRIVDGLDVGR